jgi:hypothetical protein
LDNRNKLTLKGFLYYDASNTNFIIKYWWFNQLSHCPEILVVIWSVSTTFLEVVYLQKISATLWVILWRCQQLGYVESNDKKREWCVGRDLEGIRRGRILSRHLDEGTEKISVRIAGIPAKLEPEHLVNTSQTHYRDTKRFGPKKKPKGINSNTVCFRILYVHILKTLNLQEVLGRTNRLFSFNTNGAHRKRRVQQFFHYNYHVPGHYPSSCFYWKHATFRRLDFVVLYLFVAAVMFLSSRCLETVAGLTYRHTDWWERFMKFAVEMCSWRLIQAFKSWYGGIQRQHGDLISLLQFFFKMTKVI